jgi:DnaD/phage-associated family protein
MDNKIKHIQVKYKLEGFAIIMKLYQKIYGGEGYWCEWSEDTALLFADEIRCDFDLLNEVVNEAVKRGLFDGKLYAKKGILTSKGIQKRYREIVRRRTNVNIIEEYWIIDNNNEVSDDNNEVNDDILTDECKHDDGKSTQSKVNKSKVNNIKEEDNGEQSQGEEKKDHLPHHEISEDMIKIQKSYQEMGFGLFAGFVVDEVNSYIDDDLGILVLEALKEAQTNNKVSWAYAKKCIQSWIASGIKTIDQLEAARNSRQQQKTQQIRGPDKRNNCGGFDQRKYSNEFYDSFYETGEGG